MIDSIMETIQKKSKFMIIDENKKAKESAGP